MKFRHFLLFLVVAVSTTKCHEEDENSEDVFEIPQQHSGSDDEMMTAESENPGMDGFVTSTEMIELNDTSLEVKQVSKANLFTPITPLDPEAVFLHNFSTVTFDMDSKEDSDSDSESSEILAQSTTTFSIPIDEVVADRRVLKEKEPTGGRSTQPQPELTSAAVTTTTVISTSSADDIDENETPFDQSALEGLFEPDGSPIIDSTVSQESPAFPILKMSEEDTKILVETTTTVLTTTVPSTTVPSTTTTTTTTTTVPSTTTVTTTTVPLRTMFALPAKTLRTPIGLRIISLEFSPDFENLESGPARKLIKDISPRIVEYMRLISDDSDADDSVATIKSLSANDAGGVAVAAEIATTRKTMLGDAQIAANLLEAAIARNASRLGEYAVDSLSVAVDGVVSQAYVDAISTASRRDDASLILLVIAVSLIVVTSVALCVIMISTKKRRQSTMKLSVENSVRSMTPESGTSPQHSVHLMSYGHRHSKQQIDETNSVMY